MTSKTVLIPGNLEGVTLTGTDPWSSAAVEGTPTIAAEQVDDIVDQENIRAILTTAQTAARPNITFPDAMIEPWRLPGTRLVGSFDTDEVHECGDIDRCLVMWLVNDTDFVDDHGGTRPMNICMLIQFEADSQGAAPYATFHDAENGFYLLVSIAQEGCTTC